jgi:hypothetical protein
VAPSDSRSVNGYGHGHLVCKFPVNVTVPPWRLFEWWYVYDAEAAARAVSRPSAVFSRRTSALLHLTICFLRIRWRSESHSGPRKQFPRLPSPSLSARQTSRFKQLWRWYQPGLLRHPPVSRDATKAPLVVRPSIPRHRPLQPHSSHQVRHGRIQQSGFYPQLGQEPDHVVTRALRTLSSRIWPEAGVNNRSCKPVQLSALVVAPRAGWQTIAASGRYLDATAPTYPCAC